ncbi:MAG: DUF5916 domain-containing protein [Pyrinomonadaceae bacterium]
MLRFIKIALFLSIILFPSNLFGQDNEPAVERSKLVIPPEKANPVVVPKFAAPPVIDGRLDEEVWKTAAKFTDFIQSEPGDQVPPSKETIAYMGYDEKNLYIAYFCFDEPDKIRATVAKRDAVSSEDYVGVFLDTFNDQRKAYILQFNPLGIQADGVKTSGFGGSDFSVDIVMESKGMIHDNGWSVEVRIPFKSLRYEAGKGKFWGVDFWRRIDRFNREIDGWMPMVRGVSELQQLGRITGLDDIKTERTLEVTPSVTFSKSGERIEDLTAAPDLSRLSSGPFKTDLGVSIKYQITPNITLDAAVNPDFAEVEADAPVIRANERFPIFFAEKRPFFLEGIDIFKTSLQVVNTRNIADPDFALKLTGKIGKNTFGILGAVDDFPPDPNHPEGRKAYAGVLRLKRDVGENSNIGLIATQYHFGAKQHNSILGFDGKFQLDPRTVFEFEFAGSFSKRFFYDPEIDDRTYRSGIGAAYRIVLDYTGRNRGWIFTVSGRSKDYRADLGFTRRTDTHGADFGFRIGTEPKPAKFLIGIVSRGSGRFNVDEKGRLQFAQTTLNTQFNFQKQFGINLDFGTGYEKLYEDEFGPARSPTQTGAFFGEPERSALYFFGSAGVNKSFGKLFGFDAGIGVTKNSFDLDFGASERFKRVSPAALMGDSRLDPGKGINLRYEMSFRFQPSDPLSINFGYERSRLRRNDTDLVAFDSNIFTVRSTYQFTRFIFARTRFDYETIDGTLNSQHLFGWNPSPGTAFYIGYNDNSLYRGFNRFNGRFDDGFRRDGSRFFIRMSYLFRKSF